MGQQIKMDGLGGDRSTQSMPKRVMIEQIVGDVAVCRDQFGVEVQVSTRIRRAKGLEPKIGERWIIDRSLGFWCFAAILDEMIGASVTKADEVLLAEGWSQSNGPWDDSVWGAQGVGTSVIEGGLGRMDVGGPGVPIRCHYPRLMPHVQESETVVSVNVPQAGRWYAKLYARAWPIGRAQDQEPANAYILEVAHNYLAILQRVNHVQKTIAWMPRPIGPTSYRLKFSITEIEAGTSVRARVWSLAEAEPTTWTMVATDNARTVGHPGVAALVWVRDSLDDGARTVYWDDLEVRGLSLPERGGFRSALLSARGVLVGDLAAPELANGAVTTPKLADRAITSPKIDSVGIDKLLPGTMTVDGVRRVRVDSTHAALWSPTANYYVEATNSRARLGGSGSPGHITLLSDRIELAGPRVNVFGELWMDSSGTRMGIRGVGFINITRISGASYNNQQVNLFNPSGGQVGIGFDSTGVQASIFKCFPLSGGVGRFECRNASDNAFRAIAASEFTVGSARRIKHDIRPFADISLEDLGQIHPQRFRLRPESEAPSLSEVEHLGFIADDLELVVPEVVDYAADGKTVIGYDVASMGAVTFAYAQALHQRLIALEERLNERAG